MIICIFAVKFTILYDSESDVTANWNNAEAKTLVSDKDMKLDQLPKTGIVNILKVYVLHSIIPRIHRIKGDSNCE